MGKTFLKKVHIFFGEIKRVITFAAPKGKQRSGIYWKIGYRPGKQQQMESAFSNRIGC